MATDLDTATCLRCEAARPKQTCAPTSKTYMDADTICQGMVDEVGGFEM